MIGSVIAGLIIGSASWAGWLGSLQAPDKTSFRFSRGTTLAPGEEGRLRGLLATIAAEERIILRVIGHTGTQGDREANQALSLQRAQVVGSIVAAMSIDPDRIVFVGGLGGDAPLPKQEDESEREYQRRLARVEVQTVAQ
ncbi:MAG: OmpA family protein [Pseudomonadota bacterium]